MNSDFEKQLQRRPMREPPREWRTEILNAAERPQESSVISWILTWLWPHPRAWAGLAVAWVAIFVFHVTAPADSRVAGDSAGMTLQSFAIMQQQNMMMAQLLGSTDNGDRPVAIPAPPKPRSERPRQQIAG